MTALQTLANQLAELDIDAIEGEDDLRRTLLLKKTAALEALNDLEGSTPAEKQRVARIRDLAKEHESEGDLELDEDAIVSEGDDNGAYVQMWKWIDFGGTDLCKSEDCVDDKCKVHG